MKLNLKNPIVFFDLETTGTNINTDRIVEICYLKPEGIDSKTIKLVMDSYASPNSTNYKEVYDMLVHKNPKLSLYLTPPSGGYNKNMIKGAGLLKSIGIF